MTVYLDEVFAVNLIMDWLILWATGNLAQCEGKRWRLSVAALIGACYSIAVFFSMGKWLTMLPVKIGCSLFMLIVAFSTVSWRRFFKLLIYFYLISFLLSGASLAAFYLFGQQSIQTWNGLAMVEVDFQLFWLFVGVVFTGAAVYCVRGYVRRDITVPQKIVTCGIQLGEQVVAVQFLVDSGHCLTDPISGNSVVIVEQDILLPLFSDAIQKCLQQTDITVSDQFIVLGQQQHMAGRWRLIPYRVVGHQGLLLGFRPDAILLQDSKKQRHCKNNLVALSPQKLSASGTYQGLIPPELL